MAEKTLVVFCSSNFGIDKKYNEAGRELAKAACSLGYTLKSGGSFKGTMGAVADGAAECGGRHIGVLPRFMKGLEYPNLTETIWTDTMSERKEKMREGTVAAVALPGGIGTLDELVETLTLAKLDKYSGKIFALNLDGFYEPFKALLNHYVRTGMLIPEALGLIEFPDTVEELTARLKEL